MVRYATNSESGTQAVFCGLAGILIRTGYERAEQLHRYQRLTGDIVQRFNDAGPSIPVAFTSARWGSLASFGARTYPGTKKMYGTSGNSFVAVVEFGPRVQAKAITAGGQSGDPKSPHFGDQAMRYATGDLRDVYFYREQLQGHIERQYRPGQ